MMAQRSERETIMGEWIVAIFILTGCLFCLVAAVGLIRLPDTLTRMHAATKAGTLGAGMFMAAVAVFFADAGILLRGVRPETDPGTQPHGPGVW